AHEEAAVAAPLDGQLFPRRPSARHQPTRGGDEVVEDVLFLLQHSRPVPVLAVLTAPAQVGQGEEPAAVEPYEGRRAEGRRLIDVEPAVAVEKRGPLAVFREPLPPDE